MTIRNRAIALAVVAVLVALGVALWPRSQAATVSRTQFALPALQGNTTVDLSSYRGHPVVVDLFASWCDACRSELPILASASRQLTGKVTFIGVDSQDAGDGLGMAKSAGISAWPLARDTGASQSDYHAALGIQGMPVTAFYNAQGMLVATDAYALTAAELRTKLADYFGIT